MVGTVLAFFRVMSTVFIFGWIELGPYKQDIFSMCLYFAYTQAFLGKTPLLIFVPAL
jgi:hypothetical protein